MPPDFHLLAQMKVSKAKGPNTIWAERFGKRARLMTSTAARCTERHRTAAMQVLFDERSVLRAAMLDINRMHSVPKRSAQIVFRPFALVTFIWASK